MLDNVGRVADGGEGTGGYGGGGTGGRVRGGGYGGGVRKGRFGSAHTRRCTHKAVCTRGGLWPPQESCYLRGVRGLAPASSEASPLSSVAGRRIWGGIQGGYGGEG